MDKKTALSKAEGYCAYQERSQYEVRGKLISLGVYGEDQDQIIGELIQNNYLNEERFANAYALGKLRLKSWGKKKIIQGLKFKQVSLPLIKKAISAINSEEYEEILKNLLEKKSLSIIEKDMNKRNYKLSQYALSKGFEPELIFFTLKNSDL